MPRTHDIEVFYDGDCPICRREIDIVRRRDVEKRVRVVDIAHAEFVAAHYGKSHSEFMQKVHARFPDGTWITGVEVFRHLYSAIGFKWLVRVSRVPGISGALDIGYWVFARYRLKWTGRCERDGCKLG